MRLVDIGCGTGEDAIHFARRGIDVTAIDVSPAMIAQVKLKSGGSVRCKLADMRTCAVEDIFDGVFSNFSALNYVPDLDWFGQIRLTAGAHLVFTTLGRFYPLESAVFTFKGQPCRAFRRFKPSVRGEINGENFDVYYHSLRKILNALGRGVHLKKVLGLRALRPHARAGAPRAIRSSQCCQTNGSLVVFPPPDGRARGSIRFRMADA